MKSDTAATDFAKKEAYPEAWGIHIFRRFYAKHSRSIWPATGLKRLFLNAGATFRNCTQGLIDCFSRHFVAPSGQMTNTSQGGEREGGGKSAHKQAFAECAVLLSGINPNRGFQGKIDADLKERVAQITF